MVCGICGEDGDVPDQSLPAARRNDGKYSGNGLCELFERLRRMAAFCAGCGKKVYGMKIITVCGSLSFQKEMMEIAEKLELSGNCVIVPIYPVRADKADYTDQEIEMFDNMHREKIKMADAILVVNVNHYIGSSTKNEIAFAQSLNKEILYYTDLISGMEEKA